MSVSDSRPGFWVRSNIQLSPVQHSGRSAAYRVHHLASNKVFVGWLGDAHRGLMLMASRLQNGTFPNTVLQALVDQQPDCALEVFLADSRLDTLETNQVLRDVLESWMAAAGENLIFNSVALPRTRHDPRPAQRQKIKPPPLPGRVARAEPKPRHSKMPWQNIPVSVKLHRACGAFKITHQPSGHVFVGSSQNLFDALSGLSSRLRLTHTAPALMQQDFDSGGVFELQVEMFEDSNTPVSVRLQQASDHSTRWLNEALAQDKVAIQAWASRGRPVSTPTVRVVPSPTAAATPPRRTLGWVRQSVCPDFAIPPHDFLHRAWFGGGL